MKIFFLAQGSDLSQSEKLPEIKPPSFTYFLMFFVIIANYKSSDVNYWILMDGDYTISGSNDFLEFLSRAALAKGDL